MLAVTTGWLLAYNHFLQRRDKERGDRQKALTEEAGGQSRGGGRSHCRVRGLCSHLRGRWQVRAAGRTPELCKLHAPGPRALLSQHKTQVFSWPPIKGCADGSSISSEKKLLPGFSAWSLCGGGIVAHSGMDMLVE